MNRYVQSNVSPGNCWQTAVACILEVDPAELPDQVAISEVKTGPFEGSYNNALQKYLQVHHGLVYSCLHGYQKDGVTPRGWHMIEGRTVRTDTNGGVQHVIVGHCGEPIWDPHPSGEGLTSVERVSFLTPRREELERGEWWNSVPCLCRSCLSKKG